MHPPAIRRCHRLAPALAVVALLALAVAPVVAKEGLEARLDAPIPMGTPAGTELLVGMTVTVLTDDGVMPVEGSPVYLKLIGPDGDVTRAAGAADRVAGHYTMRIVVPEGGARDIEVGIHGTSDLAMLVMDDPFTFGDVRPGTAQVAPAQPALTPFPRPAAVDVAPEPVPVIGQGSDPAAPAGPGLAPLLVAMAIGAAGALLAGIAIARRRRGPVAVAPPSTPSPSA